MAVIAGLVLVCRGAEPAPPAAPASRPVLLPLPDPLVMADGSPVATPEQWRAQRRPELLRLFEQNVYGKTLVGRPEALRFIVREEKKDARNGKATRLRIGILFEGREDGRQMELLVYLPNAAKGPVPLLLGLNFDGNYATTDEADIPLPRSLAAATQPAAIKAAESRRGRNRAMWPYDAILDRGYGLATAGYNDIEIDAPGHWAEGPRGLAPQPKEGDWGALGSWAWALSRAMDYLQTEPRIDPKRIGLFGFSRLGKATVWAGAQDERFAVVISQASGKGGISLYKHLAGEPVSNLAGKNLAHWFTPDFRRFANHEEQLPVDAHLLAALIAPRPLLILSGIKDSYCDPEGEFLTAVEATPVYRFLGSEGLAPSNWTPHPMFINSRIGYHLREGGHNVTPDDWQATLDWTDRFLAK